MTMCSIADCTKTIHCRGWCEMHYRRWRRTGSVEVGPMGRPRSDEATYNAVHLRLRYDRGEARTFSCSDCGERAQTWSYDRLDPDQLRDERDRPYSLSQDHYLPRCVPCHNKLDRANKRKERGVA